MEIIFYLRKGELCLSHWLDDFFIRRKKVKIILSLDVKWPIFMSLFFSFETIFSLVFRFCLLSVIFFYKSFIFGMALEFNWELAEERINFQVTKYQKNLKVLLHINKKKSKKFIKILSEIHILFTSSVCLFL